MASFKIKDITLANQGRLLIDWAESRMPVLMALREEFRKTKPLSGHRISGCLHVTKETGVLLRTLRAAGAEIAWSGCNPLTTQDEVAAALADEGISIFAWHGLTREEFYTCIESTLAFRPTLTVDDGADLVFTLHKKYSQWLAEIQGGTEETTTGVHRLRAMAKAGDLKYPIIAVNDAETKWDFDNVYGTGQSTIDGIIRATSVMLAGKVFVIAGFGHCGKGLAMRARGMGSRVIITEVDPIQALKATLEGYEVLPMDEAARVGDIFCTATGMKDVIIQRHFESMKEGAIISNTGHYDCEINLVDLAKLAVSKRQIRPNNEEYTLPNGHKIYILAQGRLVNLAAAEGHPSEVMDMSFANQALALLKLSREGKQLSKTVHDLPKEQDLDLALRKLRTMGISIDTLTPEQIAYRDDYTVGT